MAMTDWEHGAPNKTVPNAEVWRTDEFYLFRALEPIGIHISVSRHDKASLTEKEIALVREDFSVPEDALRITIPGSYVIHLVWKAE